MMRQHAPEFVRFAVTPEMRFSMLEPPTSIIDTLSDEELRELNSLLPWNAFVVDRAGRRFGRQASEIKRNNPSPIPDRRIIELDRRFHLADKRVFEVGCFEGIHTIGLAQLSREVVACDSRVVNIAKTAVRCAMFQVIARLFLWDVEQPAPSDQTVSCDILHHVGVLYHLRDPIGHLQRILPYVGTGLILDTHYAKKEKASELYSPQVGQEYEFRRYLEKGISDPFSGMYSFSRWLLLEDIVKTLKEARFSFVDIANDRIERNGPRVTIYAQR